MPVVVPQGHRIVVPSLDHVTIPTVRPRGFQSPYPWPPGSPTPDYYLPRVTQLTKLIDDFYRTAMPWGTADAVNARWDELAEIAPGQRRALIAKAVEDKDHPWIHKRNLGTNVHRILSGLSPNQTSDIDPTPYVAAGVEFLERWTTETLFAENTIYNLEARYAGTPDRIVTLKNGATALIDWKTGKIQNERNGRPYGSTELQLVAYGNAEFIGGNGGEIAEMPGIHKLLLVQLNNDATYNVYTVAETTAMYDAVRALSLLVHYRANVQPSALGTPWQSNPAYTLPNTQGDSSGS